MIRPTVSGGVTRSRRGERGSALVLTLVVLVVAWTASLLVAVALSIELRSARAESTRARLAVLLDSAVAESLAELAREPYSAGVAEHPFAGGALGSRVVAIDGLDRELELWARLGGLERRAAARIRLDGLRPRVVEWRPAGVGVASLPL